MTGARCKADSTWGQQLEGFEFAFSSLSISYVHNKSSLGEKEESKHFYLYPNTCREKDGDTKKVQLKKKGCVCFVHPLCPVNLPFSCHLGPFCLPAEQKPGFLRKSPSPGCESSMLLLTPCSCSPHLLGIMVCSHLLQMSF